MLHAVFGYQSFRKGQEEVIDATLMGKDSLVIMATGMANPYATKFQPSVLRGLPWSYHH